MNDRQCIFNECLVFSCSYFFTICWTLVVMTPVHDVTDTAWLSRQRSSTCSHDIPTPHNIHHYTSSAKKRAYNLLHITLTNLSIFSWFLARITPHSPILHFTKYVQNLPPKTYISPCIADVHIIPSKMPLSQKVAPKLSLCDNRTVDEKIS